jgi:hypothetical protein
VLRILSPFPSSLRRESWRPIALLLAALTLGGCMTWRPANIPTRALLAGHSETVVRVRRHGGEKLILLAPRITGDTLHGSLPHGSEDLGSWDVAIPLADVEAVEVERYSAGRTLLLLTAAGATAVAVVGAISGGSNDPPPRPSPPPSTGSGQCTGQGCWTFSCPLVFSWDGARWRLSSGTFGGAITRGLQRTDVDILDYATPQDGILRLRVANELAETDYLDALTVLAVDADSGFTVAPDPRGGLHTLGALTAPVSAREFRGGDALARVRDADGWNWESGPSGRDTARAEDLRDGLILTFVRPHGAPRGHLVLDANSSSWSALLLGEFVRAHGSATQAWYDSLDTRPAFAQATGARLAREAFLSAAVRTGEGWVSQGIFWEAGPEVVKRQVLDLDLSGVAGDTVVVRLESAPSFWLVDRVTMDFTADRPLAVHELPLVSAREATGRDVAPLIAAADDRYYVLAHGGAAELRLSVPQQPAGTSRTFMLRTTGWYRIDTPNDGVPNVAALGALGRDPLAISRASVARLNAALARLAGGAQ